MNTEEPRPSGLPPPKVVEGRDEMNLAEFPLSALSDRLDPNQKTLVFEDRLWDDSRGATITRRLTIAASEAHGLPTALDDEVILGLVQLSKLRQFSDRCIPFSRYQLIQILGWRDEARSYERIELSLNRWLSITLYYENAWRNRQDGTWMDENFHILDNVTLYDPDKARSLRASGQPQLPLSTFTWNDVIFRSFVDGNLKSLDFDFYKGLESSIAKRLYRFLDKRFFHRARWEFNLKEVSWEHVGLSRNYDAANLKRKLLIGIRELEIKGFIEPLPESERFRKVRSGDWSVIFEKTRPTVEKRTRTPPNEPMPPLVQALVARGITPSTARQTVAAHPAERIQAQLEVFDWLMAQKDRKVCRNPPGFLMASIKGEYAPPKGFVSPEERQEREALAAQRKRRDEDRAQEVHRREIVQQAARETAIKGFWQSLSDVERQRCETEALAAANSLQRDFIAGTGPLAQTTRKSLLDAYALKILRLSA